MFFKCKKLIELDLFNFDTRNVDNMYGIFADCRGLEQIDLSSFNTNKVKDMKDMFTNVNKECKIKSNDKRINASCYIY